MKAPPATPQELAKQARQKVAEKEAAKPEDWFTTWRMPEGSVPQDINPKK